MPNDKGIASAILPPGLISDDTTKEFFQHIVQHKIIVSAISFENEEFLFPGIANVVRFCLLTMAVGGKRQERPRFAFYLRQVDQVSDERRYVSLSEEDFYLLNPNTATSPIFRSQADAELTKQIYRRIPVLIDDTKENGNPWRLSFRQGLFNMATDSRLFGTNAQLREAGGRLDLTFWTLPNGERWVPLYEAKFIWHYDHRFGSYHNYGKAKGRGGRGLPPVTEAEHVDPYFRVLPRYWIDNREVESRLSDLRWRQEWLLGWRDVTSAKLERTVVPAAIPRVGTGDTLLLMFPSVQDDRLFAALLANLGSLPCDYVARQKVGGTHLKYVTFKQLCVLSPAAYVDRDLDFIVPRVLELTYTARDMQPFAKDLGYEGEPFGWDPERRAVLRAELDAYYAYLYGLSKKELRYILDPKDVMGEDYPSETFRVLKEREIKEHGLDDRGMWRTQRLVLDAYDRLAVVGTFDPARLEDPEYFPIVRAALAVSKGREQELERRLQGLVSRAEQEARPVLFVEGASDAPIVEAAWRALFPGESMPLAILPAGGTDQMRSLAGKGGALKMALDKTILALADNDGAGRALSDASDFKKLKAGGTWGQLENGISWCLLAPTEELRQVMARFKIPETNWPCTVEQCFSAALRRQAAAEGAYAVSRKLFPDLLVGLKDERTDPLWELDEDDDAYWYVRAPHPDCKERFAAWVADPARLTPGNFSGFGTLLTQLKELLAQGRSNGRQPPQQRRLA